MYNANMVECELFRSAAAASHGITSTSSNYILLKSDQTEQSMAQYMKEVLNCNILNKFAFLGRYMLQSMRTSALKYDIHKVHNYLIRELTMVS